MQCKIGKIKDLHRMLILILASLTWSLLCCTTLPSTSLPLWVRKTCWPWLSVAPGGRLLRKPGPRILVSLCSHTCTTTSYS